MAMAKVLQKYTFEFLEFDKNGEITFSSLYSTKAITKTRAGELVREKIKFHKSMKSKFAFVIKNKNGDMVPLKSLL